MARFIIFFLALFILQHSCTTKFDGGGSDDVDGADARDGADSSDQVDGPGDGDGWEVLPDIDGQEEEDDVQAEDAPSPDVPDVSVDPDVLDLPDIDDVLPDPDASDEVETPPTPLWVSIPAGSFEMGCSPGDVECDSYESPRHTVTVSGFSMTETEITQAQYEWVIGSNPSSFSGCPDCPADQVTWNQAKAFCETIGARLPSEAEWEYAARGGTTTRYYCGDDAACLDGIAWYDSNSTSTTHPVAGKSANGFFLYDMLGNVWEWVEDCWHLDYTGAPSTGDVWSGGDCTNRVLRGGSWSSIAPSLRVSDRNLDVPYYPYSFCGFRCAQE